jgi:hypothetical protein
LLRNTHRSRIRPRILSAKHDGSTKKPSGTEPPAFESQSSNAATPAFPHGQNRSNQIKLIASRFLSLHDAIVHLLNRGTIVAFSILSICALTAKAQTNSLPMISALDATNYIDQEVVVTDRVAQVAFRATVVLMNLNKKYPESPLTCVVRNQETNKFPDLGAYFGRRLEVTGRIINFQGRPEIILTSSTQIKLLDETPPQRQVVAATNTPATASEPTNAVLTPASPTKGPSKSEGLGLFVATSAGALGLLGILFAIWRGRKSKRKTDVSLLLPARSGEQIQNHENLSAEEWKRRALLAEAMAGKDAQLIREKIIPELTEFAKESLVQGLFAQRKALLDAHEEAQRSLAELEARLAALQLPLQERIQAYEKRVAELEREVATQGEGVRELTRATLSLVRRKLEEERQLQRNRPAFN